ncbi:hypothetical protein SARC_09424, partial [Sphaeroforma arctica JP610]
DLMARENWTKLGLGDVEDVESPSTVGGATAAQAPVMTGEPSRTPGETAPSKS